MAAIAAVVYGVTQEGALGTIGLVSAALALAFLAGVDLAVRDATVPADDAAAVATAASASRAPSSSVWPLVGALGLIAVGVGFVTVQPLVVIGVAMLVAATLEWMLQAWSERASSDRDFNEEIREHVASPLELPILAAIGAGGLVYAWSRVMLNLSKSGTVAAFATAATVLLLVAGLFAVRRGVRSGTIFGVGAIVAVALIAGGTAAGVEGERDMHEHETTGDLAARGECGEEETEADEDASQTVSAKANVAAQISLEGDALSFDQPGYDDPGALLTLPRSTAVNLLFRNETPEPRRLVIADLPVGDGTEVVTVCTALVEEGGVQLLTVEFDKPSMVTETGTFVFTVPGVESAQLPVMVP